jgi:gliding motility-associated-like protein
MNKILMIFTLLLLSRWAKAQLYVSATGNFMVTCAKPQTGKINLNVTGGVPPVTFLWQDGNTNMLRENLAVGKYTVTVADNSNQKSIHSFEIKSQNTMTYSSSFKMYCGYKPSFSDVILTLPGGLKNAVYPVTYYNIQKPDPKVIYTAFPIVAKDSSFTFYIQEGWHTVMIDARQCTLIYEPIKFPKWDVSMFSAKIENHTLNEYYKFDENEELTLTAKVTIPDDSLSWFGWGYSVRGDSNLIKYDYQKTIKIACKDTANLFFVAANKHGCERFDLMNLCPKPPKPEPLSTNAYLPNIFSPNDDGINDQLTIYGASGVEKVISMRVFDQWGNLIFEQKDFPPNDNHYGWNGTYKGIPANQGVYTCNYFLLLTNGKEKILNNAVQLNR